MNMCFVFLAGVRVFCDRCRSNLRHRAKAVLGHRKRKTGKRAKPEADLDGPAGTSAMRRTSSGWEHTEIRVQMLPCMANCVA